jgi:hypothetical protein
MRNEPPVESDQRSFRKVEPNVEEIGRYEYRLRKNLVSRAWSENWVGRTTRYATESVVKSGSTNGWSIWIRRLMMEPAGLEEHH